MRNKKTPDPNSTTGSAVGWTQWGENLWGGNLDCKGIIAQGYLYLGSLFGGTQLELFYTTIPLNKFFWHTSCQKLCFGKSKVELEGRGSSLVCVCVCGRV